MSLRPKLGTLEEDLAAFEAGRLTPSTRVQRVKKEEEESLPARAKQQDEVVEKGDGVREKGDDEDVARMLDQEDEETSIGGILRAVQEREETRELKAMFLPSSGFPKAFKAEESTSDGSKAHRQKGVSLFKQKRLAMRGESVDQTKSERPVWRVETPKQQSFSSDEFGDKEYVKENEALVASMSHEEIVAAQREIREMISPSVLEKFMAKLSSTSTKNDNPRKQQEKSQASTTVQDLSWIRTHEDLELAVQSLPPIEKEKLRWTGMVKDEEAGKEQAKPRQLVDLDDDRPDIVTSMLKDSGYTPSFEEVRFDLNGDLVAPPLQDQQNEQLHSPELYHHGRDPDKPGYTLKELVKLGRSKAAAQQALALNTIAKILEKRQNALYETPSKHPLFSIPRQLGLLIRMAIDSPNSSVVLAGLEALLQFISVRRFQDELFLLWQCVGPAAAFLPSVVPRAQGAVAVFGRALDNEPLPDAAAASAIDNQVEDSDRIQASPVLGMLAVGLVERLSFLLGANRKAGTGVNIGTPGFVLCCKVLSHIACHSDEAASRVFQDERLLLVLCDHITPTSPIVYNALELLQVLAAARKEFAVRLAGLRDGAMIRDALGLCTNTGDLGAAASAFLRLLLAAGVDPVLLKRAPEWTPFFTSMRTIDFNDAAGEAGLLLLGSAQVSPTTAQFLLERISETASPPSSAVWFLVDVLSHRSNHDQASSALDQAEYELTLFWEESASDHSPGEVVASESRQDSIAFSHKLVKAALSWLLEDLSRVPPGGKPSKRIPRIESLDRLAGILKLFRILSKDERVRSSLAEKMSADEIRSRLVVDILESKTMTQRATGKDGSLYSPRLLFWSRTCSIVRLECIKLLIRLYGTTSADRSLDREALLSQRLRVLCLSMPRFPHRTNEPQIFLELFRSILSPNLEAISDNQLRVNLLNIFMSTVQGLVGSGKASGSLRAQWVQGTGGTVASSKVYKKLQQKWEALRSAWVLFPVFFFSKQEEDKYLLAVLHLSEKLLANGCIEPEDLVTGLVRVFSESETEAIFGPIASAQLNLLVDAALQRLLQLAPIAKTGEQGWYRALERSAGGKTELFSLWQALVVAFNEKLNGLEAAGALLLLMLRMDSDRQLRGILWVDLHGGNLLRMIEVPQQAFQASLFLNTDVFTTPGEVDPEILRCMTHMISRRTLTRVGNPFLFNVVKSHLAQYLWQQPMSWTRARLLKSLILDSTYWEVCCTGPDGRDSIRDGSQEELEVHPQALEIVQDLARTEPDVWKHLHQQGRIPVNFGPGE